MSAQRQMFDPGPALGDLSDREEAAYELLLERPSGVTSTELGVHVHMTIGYPCACSLATICPWAMSAGEQVGKQLRRRKAVVKRGNVRWTLLPGARPRDTGELPDTY